ncbi:ricin B lectin domain-containing protein [Zychaea mexicana]|uniref:ricin B lectin domain-containing protein n=1 Tax=Zychaea mexicana TaxID=64656 RepID=UPI0022FF2C8E|nr:ricin B lectin domain-containing protein [Zychaea mexicana]KAI9493242.1 ricin B lectin domain-containing protein [Zychaea mexicana]
MPGFPVDGFFYIKSQKNGLVLDIDDGKTDPGASLIMWSQKAADAEDNDNQLWRYADGFVTNKKSGLVLDISGGDLKSDKQIVQYPRKLTMTSNQRFGLRDGFIYARADPRLVLDIRGDDDAEGAKVLLYKRKEAENDNQQWVVEPLEA